MFVTGTAFAADRCSRALSRAAFSTFDFDYCPGRYAFSVIRDFVDFGIMSICIGPFRVNVTWPVAE